MQSHRFLLALTVVVGAFSADRAFAQLGYTLCSLDWLVADADVVVLASIVKEARRPDGNWTWSTVTLDVRETLKGEAVRRLTFATQRVRSDDFIERSRAARRELLWFLKRTGPAGARDQDGGIVDGLTEGQLFADLGWGAIPLEAPESEIRQPPPPILTIDLRLLESREDILQAAREAVAAEGEWPGEVSSHRMELPRGIAQRTGRSGDANGFIAPVDHRLEAFALRLIRSPEEFLIEDFPSRNDEERRGSEIAMRPEADWLRYEGVRALRYFSSQENVAILMPLLEDTAFRLYHREDRGKRTRVYHVREAARETLIEWNAIEAVVREDLRGKDK